MNKDILARVLGAIAIALAVLVFLFANTTGGHSVGGVGGKTSTSGIYIGGLGFGVGTEQSYKTVFNSSGQLTMSSVGSAVTGLNFGTCTINAYSNTITASSSAQVDCSAGATGPTATLAGIASGDKVFVTLASTTVAISEGLHVIWSAASTTPGIITMKIANDTGGTFTWASTASSSISYLAIR